LQAVEVAVAAQVSMVEAAAVQAAIVIHGTMNLPVAEVPQKY